MSEKWIALAAGTFRRQRFLNVLTTLVTTADFGFWNICRNAPNLAVLQRSNSVEKANLRSQRCLNVVMALWSEPLLQPVVSEMFQRNTNEPYFNIKDVVNQSIIQDIFTVWRCRNNILTTFYQRWDADQYYSGKFPKFFIKLQAKFYYSERFFFCCCCCSMTYVFQK